MPNRLADAVSPYLRSHADNPVDWYEWGLEPFTEAARRNVPVLVSIGYSTCHWCHVMARESFSDPELAAHLNDRFVAIKVDREEYPDVDSTFLAAAGVFTEQLGWPLNVFVTPQGKTFFAGTYWPPQPLQGHPAFRQVLDAVTDAWQGRRAEVESNASAVASALVAQGTPVQGDLPTEEVWASILGQLRGYEDEEFGGFGGAPKFPVAPVLLMLLERGSRDDAPAAELATRTLDAMAASDLRDTVEGGFFRYSTMRDWSDPHYERMLYDNALLLNAYSRVPNGVPVAAGIADFLASVLQMPGGAFASAQDSESMVDGRRVEGVYYKGSDAASRALLERPPVDEKVLTGWNGLAIEALASAGLRHNRVDWVNSARAAADFLLERHLRPDGTLARASIGDVISSAKATLEDYGMFASGLLQLALATGEVSYAVAARALVDASLDAGADVRADAGAGAGADAGAGAGADARADVAPGGEPDATSEVTSDVSFAVPGGGDPVLESHGLALAVDPSEGAYPSGLSAMSEAARLLYLLTAEPRYLRASISAMELLAPLAAARPISFGAALRVMTALQAPAGQLVVVSDATDISAATGSTDATDAGEPLSSVARTFNRAGSITTIVTSAQATAFAAAGFELFEGRSARGGVPTAYLCRDFVCRLPVTDAEDLERELRLK